MTEQKLREYLNRVTIDLQRTRRRLAAAEAAAHEPIAIVSMSCRFPGGVRTPEQLWQLLAEGRDATTEIPRDRGWDLAQLRAGTGSGRGAFIDGIADFDAAFFAVSPHEATAMDPQQRLLLTTAWEAIERAGIDPVALRATTTGVFAAAVDQGYAQVALHAAEAVRNFLVTGNSMSVLAGRVSYALGLEGPALTVDTACSSSLVALHLATQALRRKECTLALAAGATVMSLPLVYDEFGRQGAMSADGRCKAFSATADGTGWGEGVGVLLLERLADARRNGHPVLAVIRGSALNSDGASNGLTAPNGPSQQRLLLAALADAGLTAADVDAVEAHGTGTTLGDPIEADALLATYGRNRSADRPLWLGSLKSNIGHTQAAAGIAGVIKTVLALQHGILPRSLHITEPTPHVDWSSGTIRLLSESRPWPPTERPRRAGVSAFGMSGTNAHVILEQAPAPEPESTEPRPPRPAVGPYALAGRSPAALRDQAVRLMGALTADPALDPADVGFSLAATRTAFEQRAVVVAGARADLLDGLGELARDHTSAPNIVVGKSDSSIGRTVFVFPGQGAQWDRMARDLLAESPVFAASIAECEQALTGVVSWSLTEVLCGAPGAPSLERVDVVQPALFAMMVSLAALWRSWGVEPDAVVGHSQGEIAAAVVAGGLSLADGAKVVSLRSRAIGALAGHGGMVALALGHDDTQAQLTPWAGRVSVAAVNGPASTVVSGDPDALAELVVSCDDRGVRATRVPVDYASHSGQVERIADELLSVLADISPRTGRIPLFSTLTGDWLDTAEMNADYWYRNLRATVRFETAIGDLARQGHDVFVEVSPHPVLTVPVQDTVEAAGATSAVVVGTLRRDEGGLRRVLASAAELWVRGVTVDWTPAFVGAGPVGLPTYPFQERRFWPEPVAQSGPGALGRPADPLRYRIAWHRLADPSAALLTGRWLLVVPGVASNSRHAQWIERALTELGADLDRIELADEDVDRDILAARLRGLGGTAPTGIVSLSAIAERPHPRYPALPVGVALTVALVQALADIASTARLWCVTSGAITTDSADVLTAPRQAMVWGVGMVAALEQPHRWGGLLDLPPEPDDAARIRLGAALSGAGDVAGEDQLALRPSGLFARRLMHAARPSNPDSRPWRPRGTVLLTGGTGAVGGHLARWLARGGSEHVVVPGRHGAQAPAAAQLRGDLTAYGARLSTPVCDLADRDQVERMLADLDAQGTPVTAVVHAAAFIALAPLTAAPLGAFADVVGAKAAGAAHLDALLDRDLDAFVLVSSIAGLWGSGDHGAYAAGNAYLHALAQHRRMRGLTATTVDWGVWRTGDPGTAPAGDLFKLDEHGLRRMDPATAIAALQQTLDDDETVIAVADVDWDRFAPVFASSRPSPLLQTIPEARSALQRTAADPSDSAQLRQRLDRLPVAERRRALLDLARTHAAAVLGHDSPRHVPPGKAFQELGFASLTAVELRNRLNAATGLRLPSSLVFDHPCADALAAHLEAELFAAGVPTDTAPAPTTAPDDDPIAIVAMSCRLPGGIDTPEKLWQLLCEGGDTISGFPSDRGWPSVEELFDPDPDHPGTATTRHGGFLHDAAEFDAGFFGISPREAIAMDPQQRLLLETSWEAMERAGLDPETLRGSRTGVYIGVNYGDYGSAVARSGHDDGHLLTGSAPSIVSGRIAYTFGLEGPALTVDTACSSSLVALHTAVRALRSGDCALALVGGVAVMSMPGAILSFSRQRGLAADGHCKAFAEAADGMGMGEGVGVLIVERLSDARRTGHPVLAVLRGCAVNSDGASNGLSAPNGPSQQRVIRAALADARLSAADVDVVEAHGTGTTLGDPIEAQALLATYGRDRTDDRPLLIGSLKSNIGHTQAASGVAGVMKMVLALRHAQVPPTLHIDEPTSHVDWDAGAVALVTELSPWPQTDRVRRAGVSSFGLSGTNAHVVLEQAPEPDMAAEQQNSVPGPLPWVLSARTSAALAQQAARLSEHVDRTGTVDPADVGRTLAGRTAFAYRRVLVGDRDELPAALHALAGGTDTPAAVSGVQDIDGKTVFVFPGQGSQWPGMARELLVESAVFADRMSECAAALSAYVDWSLLDVVRSGAPLDRVDVVQPVLFAMMVSLAAVWRSHGVVPDAVVGHSQGEIAAAVVAGGLSLADGARVVALRSRALGELAGTGAMASIALPLPRVEQLLASWGARLSVAAVNGPSAVVVSGETEAIGELLAACDAQAVRSRRIDVDYASHSAHVHRIESELLRTLDSITPRVAEVPLLSTVTGEWLDTSIMDAAYWYENLRRTVVFEPAVLSLSQQGFTAFIEVSPHPVLTVPIEQTLEAAGRDGTVLATLRRDEGDIRRLLLSLGEAWSCGRPVNWSAFFPGARRIDLPTYPFQHRHYWALPAAGSDAADLAASGLDATRHPLLSAATEIAGTGEILLGGRLSLHSHPWLADHAVSDVVLLPGTAFVELALQAATEAGCAVLDELALETPLVLPVAGAARIQVRVDAPAEDGSRTLAVYSRPENRLATQWIRHATGSMAELAVDCPTVPQHWPPPGATPVAVEDLYDRFGESGYRYGPAFRGVRAAWRRGDEVFTEVRLPDNDDLAAAAYGVHPALLDAALHGIRLGPAGDVVPEPGTAQVPFSWNHVRLHAIGATHLRVRLTFTTTGDVAIEATDPQGSPVVSVAALAVRPIPTDSLSAFAAPDALLRVEWTPLPGLGAPLPATGQPAVLGPIGAQDQSPTLLDCCAPEFAALDVPPDTYADLDALGAAIDTGAPVPDVVLVECRSASADAETVRTVTATALALIQQWLADDRYSDSRLVVVTSGAVEASPGEGVPDLAGAAVCGLVRSAQSEYPDRFVLVDAIDPAELFALLPTALATGEPQLVVRVGGLLGARLARVPEPSAGATVFDPSGTVLITGASGVLAGLIARHLVRDYEIRRLLLVSRRGPHTPEAAGLVADLSDLGAEAQIVACDVSDRDQLAAALAQIPAQHPLTAVVHTAGVLDDGIIPSLTTERLHAVLEPKVDGALHLHDLTRELPLSAFLLFSSAAGVIGNAGQANYAAANAFLDALAADRRAQGRTAQSIAWGLWAQRSAMTEHLDETNRQRVTRGGVAAFSDAEGLTLFDAVLRQDAAVLVPVRLDLDRHRLATAAEVPALLRGLVREVVRPVAATAGAAEANSLRLRLAELDLSERKTVLADLVREKVARVLRHPDAAAVDPELAFQDLGFDSLTSVELRNQLNAVTGLRLPATLVFDHPTPEAVAAHIAERLVPAVPTVRPSEGIDDESVRHLLATISPQRLRSAGLLDALLRLQQSGPGTHAPPPDEPESIESESIEGMDVDGLVRMALGDGHA
ncbi:SDR family NAD(P)-dependent oxidoreductase [Nocardia sp. CNY236]|uniref:SDR family NAD(P)-dependent oxidoreductase n=1 Tax=Nocardia sp. CNY236 TaxID=1169152 RepID=UPI00040DA66B|nr:type I polyketide synthase [Nocardia sp. CNY236]